MEENYLENRKIVLVLGSWDGYRDPKQEGQFMSKWVKQKSKKKIKNKKRLSTHFYAVLL